MKPPPAFKERDITPGSEAAPSPQAKKPAAQEPQRVASMHLVEQARAAIVQGRAEAAISLLEQAIQVDVYNGEAFFGLARAWRMKGSPQKSLEFARKAEILFQDDTKKLKDVYKLEAEVYRELGDASNAEAYRQKSSGL